MSLTHESDAKEILMALFHAVDKSGDKSLSLEEMIRLCEVGFGQSPAEAKRSGESLFKQCDKFGGDKKVTSMEYFSFMMTLCRDNNYMKDPQHFNEDFGTQLCDAITNLKG